MQTRLSIRERILNKVIKQPSGCWEWTGGISKNGYGQAWLTTGYRQGINTVAHRVSYIAFVGDIPAGLQIDHLCKNRKCVNPEHLEAVTAKENVWRSDAEFKRQIAKTHCPAGHEYVGGNMYVYPTKDGGETRNCRTCMRARSKARYWQKVEALNAA